jgi:hypothetical protein
MKDSEPKTTYGQKGGEGPNTGKTAVHINAVFNGETLKKRFFRSDIPLGDVVVAVHVGMNCIWTVAIDAASMPEYVHAALAKDDGVVVLVSGRRVK